MIEALALAVYICSSTGSFYDCPVKLTATPAATDNVCTSINPVGPWTPAMGRPCNFVLFSQIPDANTIAVCDISSGSCKNQNGGVESYVLKSSISGGSPSPPVPQPPTGGVGSFTLNWKATTASTDGSADTPIGYCHYYGLSLGAMTTKTCVGNVTTVTVTGLATGTYYGQSTTLDATGESGKTNVWSVPVGAQTTPPPITTPQPNYTVTAGIYTPKKGSSNITGAPTFASLDACHAYLGTLLAGTYSCGYSGEKVVVK